VRALDSYLGDDATGPARLRLARSSLADVREICGDDLARAYWGVKNDGPAALVPVNVHNDFAMIVADGLRPA